MKTASPILLISRGVEDRPPRGGFTVVELVLTMMIVAVLAAIAVPRYAGALSRYHADAAARRVVADLTLAQDHARAISAPVEVRFDLAAHTLTVVGMAGLDVAAADHTTALGAPPYHSELLSVGFDDRATLTFDGFGRPSAGGRVVLRSGERERSVVVDPTTGRAGLP